ncbi:MAG: pirin family protein [Deltaproteobacteria bacterium]|nr:pirin family protein [Deltaproteobacteria bacterium]
MQVRRSRERGFADHGWLRSYHTFSFADYYDPRHMGFRALRVINEDRVAPSAGFPTHGHRDMEIVSYVLSGGLEHKDSMGTGSVIRPGDVQRMSAGTGVRHSEYNASSDELVHFLQIWILPDRPGLTPSYEQRSFPDADKRGRLRLVASPDGADGSVRVHQDARISAALVDGDERVTHAPAPGRSTWIHVARGALEVDGVALATGDAAAVGPGAAPITLSGGKGAEVLVFDLA